jgi:hypothetical protein
MWKMKAKGRRKACISRAGKDSLWSPSAATGRDRGDTGVVGAGKGEVEAAGEEEDDSECE